MITQAQGFCAKPQMYLEDKKVQLKSESLRGFYIERLFSLKIIWRSGNGLAV
jgi:hypothetical protein